MQPSQKPSRRGFLLGRRRRRRRSHRGRHAARRLPRPDVPLAEPKGPRPSAAAATTSAEHVKRYYKTTRF